MQSDSVYRLKIYVPNELKPLAYTIKANSEILAKAKANKLLENFNLEEVEYKLIKEKE